VRPRNANSIQIGVAHLRNPEPQPVLALRHAQQRRRVAAQRDVGEAYREVFGRHFPAMSMLVVAGLVEDRAKVEIEATAHLG